MGVGFQVIEAEDGGAGFDQAITQLPDVILLDPMMPVTDGLQVLSRLKGASGTHSIPVMMVSAKGRDEDVTRALREWAWNYLPIPGNREPLRT